MRLPLFIGSGDNAMDNHFKKLIYRLLTVLNSSTMSYFDTVIMLSWNFKCQEPILKVLPFR